MANIKSAIKRVRVNEDHRQQNQTVKTDMRSHIKKVETLIANNDVENAKTALVTAVKKIDKAVQKGLIHQNNGDRQKSRLAQKVNGLSA
ncbi:small subunit ribosomal protein S20 [Gracilibacillus orientalis]|uniref:Small ribosomal subunit protein bS20 n=1 Tax=Gracilibacillus orientalis TaxID=334253 RepID=A0A1I4KQA6_9BACI|nr:30S ribosomal protein S20 [Gracilibacillus orientalis]SFL80962.1 small subunit ribosomal protein S20 [Gracilibacillus orientalis]